MIFRPEILKCHPYSIFTGQTIVRFVINCLLKISIFVSHKTKNQVQIVNSCVYYYFDFKRGKNHLDKINSNQAKFVFIVLLLGMCSIEGAEEATGTIAAETRELEAIEAVINGGHGTSMRPFVN